MSADRTSGKPSKRAPLALSPLALSPLALSPLGPLLLGVSRSPFAEWDARRFPFSVPALRDFRSLDLDAPVTLFVGENGTGKSTLLEALAVAAELPALGSDAPRGDPTLADVRTLAGALRLSWRVLQRHGFFLRAEDYFGFIKGLVRERALMEQELADFEAEYAADGRSGAALGLAQGPLRASLADMTRRYGRNPDARSHGESFLDAFTGRIVAGRGLYLLDEPEAALSPQRQLAFVGLVLERVATGAQFVIATHAPIVLALALAVPGARLYSFDDGPPAATTYDELPHVTLTREFLAAPERYLRHLGGG